MSRDLLHGGIWAATYRFGFWDVPTALAIERNFAPCDEERGGGHPNS